MYVEWVKRGGAQGGCVDVGGVPVPFCILNSSTSVQPFSVVAAEGCNVCVYVCMYMFVYVYGCFECLCLSAYVHALLKVLVVTRTLIRRRQRLIFNNSCR